jgi:xanthine/uracil/vitamin C permease (AzgA family)
MPYYHPMMHPFIGIGIGLFWLIIVIGVAYLIYGLIKSERILVQAGQLSEPPRIFCLKGTQRES